MDKSARNRAKKKATGLHIVDFSNSFKSADVFDAVVLVYSNDKTVFSPPDKTAKNFDKTADWCLQKAAA